MIFYHWRLNRFLADDKLPIFFSYVAPGEHPALEFHDHNTSEIVFVLSGEADHIVQSGPGDRASSSRNHTVHVRTGDVLVLHPGCVHAYDHPETLEIFNLVYDRTKLALPILDGYSMPLFHSFFPRGETPSAEATVKPVMNLSSSEMAMVTPLLTEMQLALTTCQPGGFYESLGLFMRITSMLGKLRLDEASFPRQSRYQIANALLLMARKYASPLSLDDLARSVNISRRNFCRQFRQMTGTSPLQYLLQLRINRAIELLQTTDLEMTSIAQQCGFCDSNYFCKQFKKICHKTPGSYRKALQK